MDARMLARPRLRAALNQSRALPYLQLMRPANLVTAAADILAGFAAAGLTNLAALPWLLGATLGLYGGGVVLNDFFDRKLDVVERPERPIPSGRATARGAAALGVALLAIGIGAASIASLRSGALALLIALCAVLYDAWGKHQRILGPLNMGACRGLNLLLGVSAVPALLEQRWYLALIPVAYIAAITAISAGEVHGGKRGAGLLALGLISGVVLALLALAATPGFHLLALLPFLALFAARVLPPFWRAYVGPQPALIRAAVKAGVLSLIVLDAAIAAGYAGILYGLLVLALLFVAAQLARLFAVT
jgi:4-hydroxybenzoate polyprenyltransferase